jgi:hypothetical protein
MSRRAIEQLAALLAVGFVLIGASCILGPKQDVPDSLPGVEDGGGTPDTGFTFGDTSASDTGKFNADAMSDAPQPPGDRCGDEGDGGDAGDADAREGGCDAANDGGAPDAHDGDAHDGDADDAPRDEGTGG